MVCRLGGKEAEIPNQKPYMAALTAAVSFLNVSASVGLLATFCSVSLTW
jgi:hypothetical protein